MHKNFGSFPLQSLASIVLVTQVSLKDHFYKLYSTGWKNLLKLLCVTVGLLLLSGEIECMLWNYTLKLNHFLCYCRPFQCILSCQSRSVSWNLMVKKSHTTKIKCKYRIEKFNWKVTSRSCSYVFFKGENNNYYYFQVVIVIFILIYHSFLVVSTLCPVPYLPQGCRDLVLTLLGLYQTWIKCQDHQDGEGDPDDIQTFLPAFFNQPEKQCKL